MRIQKYRAKIIDTNIEIVGYITEAREHLGNGSYGKGVRYIMNVTEKSMPGSSRYGCHVVEPNSIVAISESEKGVGLNETEKRHLKRLIDKELRLGRNSVVASVRLHVIKEKLK